MNGEGRRRDRRDPRSSKKQKLIRTAEEERESKFGFDLFSEGDKRLGWLLTSSPVSQFWSLFINFISMYIYPVSQFLDDYVFICFDLVHIISYFTFLIGSR